MITRCLFLAAILLGADAAAQGQFSLQQGAPAASAAPPAVLGVWGTPAQCKAHLAGEFEHPGLYPYVISGEWIQQGLVACYLWWQGFDDRAQNLRARAFAQCGEDGLREYRIFLSLQTDGLRIRWSEDFTTGALQPC